MKVFFGQHDTIWPQKLARSFDLYCRYIDDLIVFNNKKFLEYVKDIYPSQLNVEKTNQFVNLASYLDLTFTIERNEKFSFNLYDKRDDFDPHIVNFQFLSSNISSIVFTMMISDIAIKC